MIELVARIFLCIVARILYELDQVSFNPICFNLSLVLLTILYICLIIGLYYLWFVTVYLHISIQWQQIIFSLLLKNEQATQTRKIKQFSCPSMDFIRKTKDMYRVEEELARRSICCYRLFLGKVLCENPPKNRLLVRIFLNSSLLCAFSLYTCF